MNGFRDFPEFELNEIDSRIAVIQSFLRRYGYLADGFTSSRLDESTSQALAAYKRINLLPLGGKDFSRSVALYMAKPRCRVSDAALLSDADKTRCSWSKDKAELVYSISKLLPLGSMVRAQVIDNPLVKAFSIWADNSNFPIKKFRLAARNEPSDVDVAWVAAGAAGSPLLDENVAHCDSPPCAPGDGVRHLLFRVGDGVQWFSSAGTYYDFEAVALHELGHLIGLDHNPLSNIMQSTFDTGPVPSRYIVKKVDTDAIDQLYGVKGGSSFLIKLRKFFHFGRSPDS